MKQSIIFAGCCVILMGLVGCQGPSVNKSGVEVIIEGGGEFPQFLVGRWKSRNYAWQFVFEPNGAISSAAINMGEVEITAGQTATFPTDEGSIVFEPGLWTIRYDPQFRELTVEIVMNYVRLERGPNVLEGKERDLFTGEISQDGNSWQADWFSFPDYMAYTSQTRRLTVPPERSFIGTVTFEKLQQ